MCICVGMSAIDDKLNERKPNFCVYIIYFILLFLPEGCFRALFTQEIIGHIMYHAVGSIEHTAFAIFYFVNIFMSIFDANPTLGI